MYSLPQNLINSYHTLKNSKLVKNKEANEDDMKYFEHYLNKALPQRYKSNDSASVVYKFVKDLYNYNKNKTCNFFTNTPFESIILWTANIPIMKHFDIEKVVYIKWSTETHTYSVEKYNKIEKEDEKIEKV